MRPANAKLSIVARIDHLECTKCGASIDAARPQTVCPKDGGVLYVRYKLSALKSKFTTASLVGRTPTMWRYAEVLPEAEPVSLGEGFTPMLPSREFPNVYIKDEGLNPTGSFKARGMSVAVTMAKSYGLKKLAAPSAGNAGSALAAYAAAAGLEAHIFMPKDVPLANRVECESYGANVTLVDGLISDCARMVAERKEKEGWFDVSTLKEPFRVEGKKTMGYEVAEQLGWRMPQGIIYPTGGGVGLIGMWKAFEEMQDLGWIGAERPQMIAVQAAGCAPIAKAWDDAKPTCGILAERRHLGCGPSCAQGIRGLSDSRHSEEERRRGSGRDRRRNHGRVAAIGLGWKESLPRRKERRRWPRIESCAPALSSVRTTRWCLFNTGSGLKYLDVIEDQKKSEHRLAPASRQIGGIIGPY